MIFLGPIYSWLVAHYATKINHFALVKLIFLAVDKTILYFLIFAFVRLLWLLLVRHRRPLKSEFLVWLFAGYALLVFMGTVFRNSYFPWEIIWHTDRPLSDINLVFMKETWKLFYAPSRLDFFYNSLGNVLCFLPFGLLWPQLFNQRHPARTTILLGVSISLLIETLQFYLATGVSDIDDVFFNSCGTILGYLLFWFYQQIKNFRQER
ncbi:MAG: VanZ family protein [Lactobacillus sp.]|nr:VanZ family protein [Lactobacillus sp.]MDN6052357.1 VanZ family protein [Lactobacillus sp.]